MPKCRPDLYVQLRDIAEKQVPVKLKQIVGMIPDNMQTDVCVYNVCTSDSKVRRDEQARPDRIYSTDWLVEGTSVSCPAIGNGQTR